MGDLQQMANGTYDPMAAYDPYQSNRLSDVAGFDFGVQLEGYYEAEIRYNRTSGDWEVYTKGGGFTAGVGMEFGFNVNTVVGIVPVTGSFELGGAMQLSFQAATRYSQQAGWSGATPPPPPSPISSPPCACGPMWRPSAASALTTPLSP